MSKCTVYDYVSYIIVAAVGYDYILTFSKEVEYVWSEPWSWVSTLFILARYFGMCSVILHALWWNSAVSPSAEVLTIFDPFFNLGVSAVDFVHTCDYLRATGHDYRCNLLYILGSLCLWIFICSADLVMILRLWALYARSRFILCTLLLLYAVEAIAFIACFISVLVQFPNDPAMGIVQVPECTVCVSVDLPPFWFVLKMTSILTLGAWMCLLIVIQYIKELVQMYKVAKQFRVGYYQKNITWEGLVYFVATLGFGVDLLLVNCGLIPADGRRVLAEVLQEILPFTLFPRLVLSLRELYMRDLEGRRGSHMDTMFGLGILPGSDSLGPITFADAVVDEERELGGET